MLIDAAIHFLSRVPIEKTIAAVPVGPAEVIERLHGLVDEMHYLYIPENFFSVGHYYTDEPRVDKEQVVGRIDTVVSRWI